jgi:hypothetical protein
MPYWNLRNYDAMIEWANKMLELDPSHPHAREFLAGAYLQKNDPDRHMAECVRQWERHHLPADMVDALSGRTRKAVAPGSYDSSSIVWRWPQAHRL